MSKYLFTVGHSTHSIENFIALLASHGIEAIADVRSSPFSRFNPQFNRRELQKTLQDAGIRYVFLGKELGARSDDPHCYVADKVQYDRLAKTPEFQSGVDRVLEGANSYRVALMCAEKEPLDCHRTILVARELDKRGFAIRHILSDGSVESHPNSMKRLMTELGIQEEDLFRSKDEMLDEAYARQGEKIAYVRGVSSTISDEQISDALSLDSAR